MGLLERPQSNFLGKMSSLYMAGLVEVLYVADVDPHRIAISWLNAVLLLAKAQHTCGYDERSQKGCRRGKFARVCYHQDNLHRGVEGANERQGSANQPAASEAPQHNSSDKRVSGPPLYVSHLPTCYFLLVCTSHRVTVSN